MEIVGNNVYLMDCIEGMRLIPDASIDSIVTDPPYELAFMGKKWDSSGIAYNINVWKEALRVLKPGGYLLSFGGTRTYHRMACAIEDAGFEIRDMINWMYGSGFPKSLDISKAIDKMYGANRKVIGIKPGHEQFANRGNLSSVQSLKGTLGGEGGFARPWMDDPEKVEAYHHQTAPATEDAKKWEGWGTALKPAHEPIVVARKPLQESTVAKNVLAYDTGGLNIDRCRIEFHSNEPDARVGTDTLWNGKREQSQHTVSLPAGEGITMYKREGRWPANLLHDGSEEIETLFPNTGKSGVAVNRSRGPRKASLINYANHDGQDVGYGDGGTAARFFYKAEFSEDDFKSFYCAKASKKERGEFNTHATVKPLKLMEYLVRLVTPPDGICLDPFMGSGTTLLACKNQGFNYIGFDNDEESFEITKRRLDGDENRSI